MKDDLFAFNPGDGSTRFADPFAINHGLAIAFAERGQSEEQVLGLYQSKNPAQVAEAAMAIEAVARKVFDLAPFVPMNGEGCTPRSAVKTYFDFFEWCLKKKASGDGEPISPPSTEPASSTVPAATSSPSGSIASV